MAQTSFDEMLYKGLLIKVTDSDDHALIDELALKLSVKTGLSPKINYK